LTKFILFVIKIGNQIMEDKNMKKPTGGDVLVLAKKPKGGEVL
jgi:hypothetical protein